MNKIYWIFLHFLLWLPVESHTPDMFFPIVIDNQDQFSYGCCAINGQIGRRVFTNRQMWHREPFWGAALTKRGSYQLPAPNASADVIYRFLSALLRETKRGSRPLTSLRAAFISTPPLPAAHLCPRLKTPTEHLPATTKKKVVSSLVCAADTMANPKKLLALEFFW